MVSSSQPASDSKVFQEFRARGIRPTTYVFVAYDCAEIIISAIERAMQANGGKVPSRQQVLNAVASTRDFAGASGTFTFLPSGDPIQPSVSVYRVQTGSWTFWQSAS
jgi:branched-chain amino acid transport system substrate-binding protein